MTLGTAVKAACVANRMVNAAIGLVIVCVLLFSGYQLWDAWRVQHGPDEVSARLMQYKGPGGPSFRELMSINPDVVGWLTLEGTRIDSPVVQGKDDSQYLARDVFGHYSPAGSLFLAKGCASDFSDQYNLVMGHHMAEGKMFGDLDLYREDGFMDSHHTGTLWLPHKTVSLEVVAVLSADAYDSALYRLPLPVNGFDLVRRRINELALHRQGQPVDAGDRLVALSTCASGSANERTVVICRVSGESAAGDTT